MDKELFNINNRNLFIENNKSYIYKVAYSICKRNLSWENDDELAIALIAFNKACDSYDENKGEFFSYAKPIIKNSLIDYFRKNKDTPYLVFEDEDESIAYIENKRSLEHYSSESENKFRSEEINLLSKELAIYKLNFNILVEASPSHKDTRNSLLNLAISCIKEDKIISYIKVKGRLPIKEITLQTGINKKVIDKWRRYLLTLIIILTSEDYPYIKAYLNIKEGESNE